MLCEKCLNQVKKKDQLKLKGCWYGMSGGKKRFSWFWRIMLSAMFLTLLLRNVEPLKTINEIYSAPWYLLMLVFFISGAVWFTIAFREGKAIRREKLSLKNNQLK